MRKAHLSKTPAIPLPKDTRRLGESMMSTQKLETPTAAPPDWQVAMDSTTVSDF